MQVVQGIDEVIRAFEEFILADWSGVADDIKDAWIEQVYLQDAIDTGRFIQSIDWIQTQWGDAFERYLISTQRDVFVTYDGFLEYGTKYMKARPMAQRGVETADISPTIDDVVNDAFYF